MCSTGDLPESGVPPTGCSCHDRGGQRDRTGRGRPGDILQRLAVYQGRRAELRGATWQKLGHLRISAGLVRRDPELRSRITKFKRDRVGRTWENSAYVALAFSGDACFGW